MASSKTLRYAARYLIPFAVGVAPVGCEDDAQPPAETITIDAGSVVLEGGTVATTTTNECAQPTKGPTNHGGGSSSDPDETWTADASPHILPYDTTIYKTVTIEPCAEVLIAEGKTVNVRGKLVAEGTATRRIHVGAIDPAKPFAAIHLSGSMLRLAYAMIDGGGARLNTLDYLAGMLDLQGDLQQPTQESLFVDHVTIEGSRSNGIVLRDNAGFAAGSTGLVVHGSAVHPISIFARSVGLPLYYDVES